MEPFEKETLAIEQGRLEVEKSRLKLERKFLAKHLGAVVSLAAVGVAGTQIWVAQIGKTKELAIVETQWKQEVKLRQTDLDNSMKVKLIEFALEHRKAILSSDPKESAAIRNLMVATFSAELTRPLFARIEQTVDDASKQVWAEGRELAARLSGRLLFQLRSLELRRIGDLVAGNKSPTQVRVFVNGVRVDQNASLDVYRLRNNARREFSTGEVRAILGDFEPGFDPFTLTVEVIDIDNGKQDRNRPVLGRFSVDVDPSRIGDIFEPQGEKTDYAANNARIRFQLVWP